MPVRLLKKPRLPRTPSKLLRLALRELEKAEKARGVVIDMVAWHHREGGKCHVCLAGAVMRGFLNDKTNCHVADFPKITAKKMLAIDALRRGHMVEALDYLGITHPANMQDWRQVAVYRVSPDCFKDDMNSLADMLEAHGL